MIDESMEQLSNALEARYHGLGVWRSRLFNIFSVRHGIACSTTGGMRI